MGQRIALGESETPKTLNQTLHICILLWREGTELSLYFQKCLEPKELVWTSCLHLLINHLSHFPSLESMSILIPSMDKEENDICNCYRCPPQGTLVHKRIESWRWGQMLVVWSPTPLMCSFNSQCASVYVPGTESMVNETAADTNILQTGSEGVTSQKQGKKYSAQYNSSFLFLQSWPFDSVSVLLSL